MYNPQIGASILYLQLHQITTMTPLVKGPGQPSKEDMSRELSVHVARGSGSEVSHITMEFKDDFRAQFLVCILFDGSGDKGTGLDYVAMPKVKLPKAVKALVALSCLDYLCEFGHLNVQSGYFRAKIAQELFQESVASQRGGRAAGGPGLLPDYEALTRRAVSHLQAVSAIA